VYLSLQSGWGDVEEVKLEPAAVVSPDAAPAVEAAAKVEKAAMVCMSAYLATTMTAVGYQQELDCTS
jgi:hypothetical protein